MTMHRQGHSFALIMAFLSLLISTTEVHAQERLPSSQSLTVGVHVSPPFVMADGDGGYTGMAIDLWELVAGQLGLSFTYVELDAFGALIDAAQAGEIDIGVTNLSVTRERATRVSFTHPWFDAGMGTMVSENHTTGFSDLIMGLHKSGYLRSYAWIVSIIILATVFLTLLDRRLDKDFPKRWRDGIAESFYAVMSMATSGRANRKNYFGWVGRIFQGLSLIFGLAVLVYTMSSITSVMTTLSIDNQINIVADLSDRPIGVFVESTAEEFAQTSGFSSRPYANTEEAASALERGEIDAIIGDAPVLKYFVHTNPDREVKMVGAIFEPEKYAFALPLDSELTHKLTVEIIGLQEQGTVEEIRKSYFGVTP